MCFKGKENSLVDSAMFDKKNLMQISYKSKVPENSSKKTEGAPNYRISVQFLSLV